MTKQQTIETMIGAQRDYCVDDIGGLRNVDFDFETMQAAYAVARDAVLETAAVAFEDAAQHHYEALVLGCLGE